MAQSPSITRPAAPESPALPPPGCIGMWLMPCAAYMSCGCHSMDNGTLALFIIIIIIIIIIVAAATATPTPHLLPLPVVLQHPRHLVDIVRLVRREHSAGSQPDRPAGGRRVVVVVLRVHGGEQERCESRRECCSQGTMRAYMCVYIYVYQQRRSHIDSCLFLPLACIHPVHCQIEPAPVFSPLNSNNIYCLRVFIHCAAITSTHRCRRQGSACIGGGCAYISIFQPRAAVTSFFSFLFFSFLCFPLSLSLSLSRSRARARPRPRPRPRPRVSMHKFPYNSARILTISLLFLPSLAPPPFV